MSWKIDDDDVGDDSMNDKVHVRAQEITPKRGKETASRIRIFSPADTTKRHDAATLPSHVRSLCVFRPLLNSVTPRTEQEVRVRGANSAFLAAVINTLNAPFQKQ